MNFDTVEQIRVFLRTYPPQTREFQVFGSAVLVHLESNEREIARLREQCVQNAKALKVIARAVGEILGVNKSEEAPTTAAAEPEEGPPRDQTPFPAGFSPVAGAATAAPAPPPSAEEIPVPDVQSGPAVNASPIPSAPKSTNGAQVESR